MLLSGCASPHDAAGPEGRGTASTITAPTEWSYVADPNESGAPHVHDYWNGRSEVVLVEAPFQLSSRGAVDSLPRAPRADFALIPLPEGATVFPGTATINVTVQWSSSDTWAKRVAVYAVSPNQRAFEISDAPSGRTHALRLNESDWDLPHSTLSRWSASISLRGMGIAPGGSASGSIRLVIIRSNEPVRPSPPHPDWWKGNASVVLESARGPLLEAGGLGPTVAPGQQPPEYVSNFSLIPVVPIGTERFTVRLEFNSGTNPAVHYQPLLAWKPADKRNYEMRGVRPTSEPKAWVWNVPVEPRMWDSPYATNTGWTLGFPHHQGGYPWGPTLMSGDWRLTLSASQTRA